MLPADFIREKIIQAFNDLAEAIADGTIEIPGMTEDEEAGIPMMLFTAQQTMLIAWQSYINGHASAPRRPNKGVQPTAELAGSQPIAADPTTERQPAAADA